MTRGEMRWYKCARPDKKRPVPILARDGILPYLGQVTVALITRTIRDIPSEAGVVAAPATGTMAVRSSRNRTGPSGSFHKP